jgi:hypothetical protein
MWKRSFISLCLFPLLWGCSMNTAPDPAELIKRYRENPHPQQAYRVTLAIADAPGPFASLEAYATYEIQGETCLLPSDNNFEGAQLTPKRRSLPVDFEKVSDTEYVATVYADRMLDADYYGRGVCHWQSTGTHVRLKATGADGETEFVAGLSGGELTSQVRRQFFFLGRNYPSTEIRNYPDFGAGRAEEYRPELQHDVFVLTLVSRKIVP